LTYLAAVRKLAGATKKPSALERRKNGLQLRAAWHSFYKPTREVTSAGSHGPGHR